LVVEGYIVDLLAALVHLRIFIIQLDDDDDCPVEDAPVKDAHPFILKVSDRAPHLEYFSILPLNDFYKRVGGKLVVCDAKDFPSIW
jgi:hypothetical protein